MDRIGDSYAGRRGFGFVVAAVLLAAFAAGIAAALRRGVAVPCRCFGASSRPVGRHHVVRNVILAGLSVAGAVGSPAAPPSPTAVLIAVAAGLLAGVLVAMLDELIGLFLPMQAQQRSVRGH
ncbi:MauE/DoxX family redox-associated membrane protein [Fodinicola acaciae]|uniref:MauE/DoxX family redox-associated membrane protein n=1 Tax=Fodinicola acaciae TaxID=2681555 RepID=UPI0013D78E5D|nr:MauE/DoxX family redox-associated membrane protein [Fodinicola acaciae]